MSLEPWETSVVSMSRLHLASKPHLAYENNKLALEVNKYMNSKDEVAYFFHIA